MAHPKSRRPTFLNPSPIRTCKTPSIFAVRLTLAPDTPPACARIWQLSEEEVVVLVKGVEVGVVKVPRGFCGVGTVRREGQGEVKWVWRKVGGRK